MHVNVLTNQKDLAFSEGDGEYICFIDYCLRSDTEYICVTFSFVLPCLMAVYNEVTCHHFDIKKQMGYTTA